MSKENEGDTYPHVIGQTTCPLPFLMIELYKCKYCLLEYKDISRKYDKSIMIWPRRTLKRATT
jgi:hypothetical protein